MAVDALTAFPGSLIAGDTLRVSISGSDYPSSLWTLAVVLRGPSGVKTFAATTSGTGFALVIPATQAALLTPGNHTVTYSYTHTDGERISIFKGSVEILPDPTKATGKSTARLTLEAMEDGLQRLAKGIDASFSANGQQFTRKNLSELQDAIERQRGVVAREDALANRGADNIRSTNLYTRFAIPS